MYQDIFFLRSIYLPDMSKLTPIDEYGDFLDRA